MNAFSEAAQEYEREKDYSTRNRRYCLTYKQAGYLNYMLRELGLDHQQEPNQWVDLHHSGIWVLNTPTQDIFAHYKNLLAGAQQ